MEKHSNGRERDEMLGKRTMSLPSGISVDHDPDDLWEDARVIVNVGPTHPAMHGALRMVAKRTAPTTTSSSTPTA